MPDLLFQPIGPATEAAARRIIISGLAEHFGRYEGSFNPDVDRLIACYSLPGHVFLVGQVAERVVCTGGLLRESNDTARIVRMSVARQHRGKGYAFRMLQQLEQQAGLMGYRSLVLETNSDWEGAVRLYTRSGYRIVARDNSCTHFSKEIGEGA